MATAAQIESKLNPLEHLAAMFEDDMSAVNVTILDKMGSDVPLIPELASHLISSGGKRIRPLLTIASTRIYGNDSARAHKLAAAVEFIHTATLLHDDVVDESDERRGKPSANIVFGNQASVLVGDFLFSRAFQLMVEDGSIDVLRILSDASATISEGEVMQMNARGDLDMTFADYEKIVHAKTAALFAAACEIGPAISSGGRDAHELMRMFGTNLGIAFQIADDVLDYSANQAKLGKRIGDDFREGKITAPVLFALDKATQEERAFWERTLKNLDQRPADLKQAQEILARHDALEHGMHKARTYAGNALLSLELMPKSIVRNALAELVSFTVEREF